jgi:DNA-binding FrmR family transcriptional regulator
MHKAYSDKKTVAQKRLNIIRGQLEGLQRMIEDDVYCIDVLTQSRAIQQSLHSLDGVLLERHLMTHVSDQMKDNPAQAIGELVTLFQRSNKS